MVSRGPPKFFVISPQGESGPYDQQGLRDALQAGEIAEHDQVRTAFGSPLGNVQRVLTRDSDRPATVLSAPVEEPPRSGASHLVLIIAGLVVILGLLALFGIGRDSAPDRSPAPSPVDVQAPSPSPPSPSPSPPPPMPAPAVVKPAPQPSDQAPVVKPAPSKPLVAALGSSNMLRGLNLVRWKHGGGALLSAQDGGVRLVLNGSGMWAGVPMANGRHDWRNSRSLVLSVQAVDRACAMQFELIEGSGERHVADFRLEPAEDLRDISIPWTSFRRRDDQFGKNPPHDGLQLDRIDFVAFWPVGDGAVAFRLHGLRLEP